MDENTKIKELQMKLEVTAIIMLIISLFMLFLAYKLVTLEDKISPEKDIVRLEQPEFLNGELNDSILLKALIYYEIKEPLIVLAQAKLESANYKSKLCIEKNNIFGLYNSKAQQYYNFDHWTNCIIAYKNMIEYKQRDGEDYYYFLRRIGYAEDSLYINKVKSIVNKLPP
jgi:hypothetical protein